MKRELWANGVTVNLKLIFNHREKRSFVLHNVTIRSLKKSIQISNDSFREGRQECYDILIFLWLKQNSAKKWMYAINLSDIFTVTVFYMTKKLLLIFYSVSVFFLFL